MAKETSRENIIGAQTEQATVLISRLTIDATVGEKPKTQFYDLRIFNVSSSASRRLLTMPLRRVCQSRQYCGEEQAQYYDYFYTRGFANYSPYNSLIDSSNGPQ